MADEVNEDSWLYGNTNPDGKEGGTAEGDKNQIAGDSTGKNGTSGEAQEDGQNRSKRGRGSFSDDDHQHDDNAMDSSDLGLAADPRRDDFLQQGEEDSHLQEDESHEPDASTRADRSDGEMDSDDSDDDDDINVVIGDIKSGPSYNIKQRGPIVPPQVAPAAPGLDKSKQPAGKFSIDEFESVGTINGVPAHEFSIDSLEEKPWRKPGADITDYFNYGFNEETWRAYCERQKRMRMQESGVGLQGLTINNPQAAQTQNNWRTGPPPPRKMANGIDVIGGMSMHPRSDDVERMMPRHPKENIIQVMTADRREYSRSANKFDPSMGPPPFGAPPEFYHNEPDYGDYGYEPTQESQWNQESSWQPHGIKTLTPGPPQMMPPGMGMHMEMMPPPMQPGMGMGPPGMGSSGMRGHDRDRGDRDRGDRERERDRHTRPRDREREHRREHREREREPSVVVKPEVVEVERSRSEKPERDREAEKEKRSSKSERHKDRYRERSRSREKSKSRRRSRSRERERERHSSRSEKKKSHRKDKEESE